MTDDEVAAVAQAITDAHAKIPGMDPSGRMELAKSIIAAVDALSIARLRTTRHVSIRGHESGGTTPLEGAYTVTATTFAPDAPIAVTDVAYMNVGHAITITAAPEVAAALDLEPVAETLASEPTKTKRKSRA